jgi:HAD superfamily hydrolase (TIGR01509 family)
VESLLAYRIIPCVTHSPLTAVIFDLGGTLVYPTTTSRDNALHLQAWLEARGLPRDLDAAIRDARRWMWEMTQATGRQYTIQEAIRRAFEQVNLPAPEQTFVEEAERVFFHPELTGYRPFPGALRLLRRLAATRVRAGCISNASSHWLIERIVDQLGFQPYLDVVVSSAGYGRVKPDPGIFRAVLNRWNVPPARAAMVGDTLEADIAGGRGLGMRTLYVTMAPNPDNVHHSHIIADAEAASLASAERILLGWMMRD